MNGQLVIVLFWTLGFIGFVALLYFVCSNLSLRPSEMKDIAEKYGLKYTRKDRPFRIKDLFMPDYRENIIEGKINDNDILIYDRITNVFDIDIGARSKSFTIIAVNGVEEKRDSSCRRVEVKKIETKLANLKNAS